MISLRNTLIVKVFNDIFLLSLSHNFESHTQIILKLLKINLYISIEKISQYL